MKPEFREKKIRELLEQSLQPQFLEITDDSHKHAGHAGAKSGAGHFNIMIIGDVFSGKNRIQRHRLIYDALNEMMNSDIHALSIQAYDSEEV